MILQGAPGQIFWKTVRPWESSNASCIDTHYSPKHYLNFFFSDLITNQQLACLACNSSTTDFCADLNENDLAKVSNFFTAWQYIAILREVSDIRVIICRQLVVHTKEVDLAKALNS